LAQERRVGFASISAVRERLSCSEADIHTEIAEVISQVPSVKCGTSLVLRGKMGTGKTIVGKIIGHLLGDHYLTASQGSHVVGKFNAHLSKCLLLQSEEAFWAGDHQAEAAIKDLITSEHQTIELKGKDAFRVKRYVRLLVTSNKGWIIPAGLEERRFADLDDLDDLDDGDDGEDCMQNKPYFAKITKQMESGGYAALLWEMLNFDLTTVDLRSIPKTEALLEQKFASFTSEQTWYFELLMNGQLPGEPGCSGVINTCLVSNLIDSYITHATKQGARRRSSEVQFGIFMTKTLPGLRKTRGRSTTGKRQYVYHFPPLPDCRATFAEMMQQEMCAAVTKLATGAARFATAAE
jgi:hypothetical protein